MESPAPTRLNFRGPEGVYAVDYTPKREMDDGLIDVVIRGVGLRWYVERVDRAEDGHLTLAGLTHGTQHFWNDVFWFVIYTGPDARIEYWGNQVLWRADPID